MGQIALKWTGDDSHLFVGRDSRGQHRWSRDCGREPTKKAGWTRAGAKASDLLVVSLCACSAYDVRQTS